MKVVQYRLESGETSIRLQGESVVGRSPSCTVRFRDPTVSRKHLLLKVIGDKVTIENLSSVNPTWVNGERIQGPVPLQHGDRVELGRTSFRIFEAPENEFSTEDLTQRTRRRQRLASFLYDPNAVAMRDVDVADTRELPTEARRQPDRRQHPRLTVDLPVIYDSKLLSIAATARDISLGGLYIAAGVIDNVGAECEITFLENDKKAIPIKSRVARTVTDAGRPPGMGIKFVSISMDAKVWLSSLLMSCSADQQTPSPQRHT